MEIDYSLIQLENLSLKSRQAVKLRGFFANLYRDCSLIHNHKEDKLIYQYPKIQYKVIKEVPTICGIEEGAGLLQGIGLELESIKIEDKCLEVFQKKIVKTKQLVGIAEDYINYQFITPWMALNQNNSVNYDKANQIEKEEILKKIMVGNILSLAKGLNYRVEKQIFVWINLEECIVNFKNIKMRGFKGTFKTNFVIPDYLGIGKSVSRGFGTIKRSG